MDEQERFKQTKIVGIVGILGNVFLVIIKGIIAIITHNQAMMSDAANSAGDIFASAMTFIGNKISSVPKDENHDFGHGKAEYVSSLFISLVMMLTAMVLIKNSIISLVNGVEFIFSWYLIVVCIITIITKLSLYLYTKIISKKFDNILLIATMKDHRNDCVVTTFTLISIILGKFGIFWFDSITSIGIAIWIFITGLKLAKESFNVLMDEAMSEETRNAIINIINQNKEVKNIDLLNSKPVGYKYTINIIIDLDGNMSTFKSHEIADKIEREVCKLPNIYSVTVHVNPV